MIELLSSALTFPNIDPVIVRLGPLAIHWYGLGYVVGILFGWWYAKRLVSDTRLWPGEKPPITELDIDDFLVWAALAACALFATSPRARRASVPALAKAAEAALG